MGRGPRGGVGCWVEVGAGLGGKRKERKRRKVRQGLNKIII